MTHNAWRVRWMVVANHLIRSSAMVTASATTFMCLSMAATKQEHIVMDVLYNVAVFNLCLAFGMMVGHQMGNDGSDIFGRRPRRSDDQMPVTTDA